MQQVSLYGLYIPTQTRFRSELAVAVRKLPKYGSKSCRHDFGTDGKQRSAYGIYNLYNLKTADISFTVDYSFTNTKKQKAFVHFSAPPSAFIKAPAKHISMLFANAFYITKGYGQNIVHSLSRLIYPRKTSHKRTAALTALFPDEIQIRCSSAILCTMFHRYGLYRAAFSAKLAG